MQNIGQLQRDKVLLQDKIKDVEKCIRINCQDSEFVTELREALTEHKTKLQMLNEKLSNFKSSR